MKRILLTTMSMLVLLSCYAHAEIIYLKNGDILRGVIASKDAQGVTVKVGSSYKRYYTSQIDKIEDDSEIKAFDLKKIDFSKLEGISSHKASLIVSLLKVNGTMKILEGSIANVITSAPLDRREEFKQLFDINGLVEKVIPIYDSYFSEEDIEGMTDFYNTSAGKKIVEYQAEINQAIVPAIADYFKEQYGD